MRYRWTLLFLAVATGLLIALGVLVWRDFDWKAWLTIVVVLLTIVALVHEVWPPDVILVCGLAVFMVSTVLEPAEALEGFADPTVFSVAVLLVVAVAIEATGVLYYVERYLLGRRGRFLSVSLMRLCVPVALLSAFLNNTPVVAMLIPVVERWCRLSSVSASKMLMPLSFASILGGTTTLIGTSTNLVVQGLAEQADPTLELGFFEVGMVGFPLLAVGLCYMLVAYRWLLPDRKTASAEFEAHPREFMVSVRVLHGASMEGHSVAAAGLRHLPGLFLVEVTREDGTVLVAPDEQTVIQANDVLTFAGVVDSVRDILAWDERLVPTTDDQLGKLMSADPSRGRIGSVAGTARHRLVEAVLSARSPAANSTAKQARFRSRYGAAIIAVHRAGERINGRLGDIELRAGDCLLLVARDHFVERFKNHQHFLLVSELGAAGDIGGGRHRRQTITGWQRFQQLLAVVSMLAMVSLNAAGVLPLAAASSAAMFALVLARCVTIRAARRAIKPTVVITIAAAFGYANALEATGVATELGKNLVDVFSPLGAIGVLFALYLVTAALTAVISNAAAVALMFPIGASVADAGIASLKQIVYTLMMAASAAFMTPISYQTHLLVFNPGGYFFSDFFRFGAPLQVIAALVSVPLCYLFY
jgi:di/tricarboxylate transporter